MSWVHPLYCPAEQLSSSCLLTPLLWPLSVQCYSKQSRGPSLAILSCSSASVAPNPLQKPLQVPAAQSSCQLQLGGVSHNSLYHTIMHPQLGSCTTQAQVRTSSPLYCHKEGLGYVPTTLRLVWAVGCGPCPSSEAPATVRAPHASTAAVKASEETVGFLEHRSTWHPACLSGHYELVTLVALQGVALW